MFETYKPSGRFGLSTFPAILIGMALVVAMAYVYQLLLEWIPLIYINFLLTLGVGIGVGMITTFIVHYCSIRNPIMAGALGLVLCLTCLGAKFWFQYNAIIAVAATEVMLEQEIPEDERSVVISQLKEEITFMKHIKFRVDQGWNIGRGGGAPVAGIFVYLIWLIELGAVLYYGVSPGYDAAGEPYSEKLRAWASEEESVMVLPISDQTMVDKIKAANSVDELLSIPIPESDQSNQFAVYKVNSIEGQELEDAYLSVDLVVISVNSKGEEEKKETKLVKHAILSSQQREHLVENASLLQEAMADYRESLLEEQANNLDEIVELDADVDPDAQS